MEENVNKYVNICYNEDTFAYICIIKLMRKFCYLALGILCLCSCTNELVILSTDEDSSAFTRLLRSSYDISEIASNNSLGTSNTATLNNCVLTMVSNHPEYESLFDYAVSNNRKFSDIKIDGSSSGTKGAPGAYNPNNKGLYFLNSSVIAEAFPEEFLHFSQDNMYSGGISQYLTVGKCNIEFEVKFIKDVFRWRDGMGGTFDGMGIKYSYEYTNMILDLETGNFPTYEEFLFYGCNYWDFLGDFNHEDSPYHSVMVEGLVPVVIDYIGQSF